MVMEQMIDAWYLRTADTAVPHVKVRSEWVVTATSQL